MKRQFFMLAIMLGAMLVTALPLQAQHTATTAGVQEVRCVSACFRSPQYCWLNLARLGERNVGRDDTVIIGGCNFNQPISVANHIDLVRRTLQGNAFPGLPPTTPLARLNQEFLAAQLSVAGSDDLGVMNGQLQCYSNMVSFRPVLLSNGATLTPYSTLGELFDEALLTIRENRTADMDGLASVFDLLNGNEPSGNCFAEAKAPLLVPQDYPTIQQAIDAALPGDVIKVGVGEFRGATLTKPVNLVGSGAQTRITSGVLVTPRPPDPGLGTVITAAFYVPVEGTGAIISNFRIELATRYAPPAQALVGGLVVRHADEVIFIHNEIIGPGASSTVPSNCIYLMGSNHSIIAFNKVDGGGNAIYILSNPWVVTTNMFNLVVHNQVLNSRFGLYLAVHRMNPAINYGPESPCQQNLLAHNLVQANVGLYFFDQSGTLRDFIRDNNITHNNFTRSATPMQENVRGIADKNYFFMNLGL